MSEIVIEFENQTYVLHPRKFTGECVELVRAIYYATLSHEQNMLVEEHGLPQSIVFTDSIQSKMDQLNARTLASILRQYPKVVGALLPKLNDDISKELGQRIANEYEDYESLADAVYFATGADEVGKSSLGSLISDLQTERAVDHAEQEISAIDKMIKKLESRKQLLSSQAEGLKSSKSQKKKK